MQINISSPSLHPLDSLWEKNTKSSSCNMWPPGYLLVCSLSMRNTCCPAAALQAPHPASLQQVRTNYTTQNPTESCHGVSGPGHFLFAACADCPWGSNHNKYKKKKNREHHCHHRPGHMTISRFKDLVFVFLQIIFQVCSSSKITITIKPV